MSNYLRRIKDTRSSWNTFVQIYHIKYNICYLLLLRSSYTSVFYNRSDVVCSVVARATQHGHLSLDNNFASTTPH